MRIMELSVIIITISILLSGCLGQSSVPQPTETSPSTPQTVMPVPGNTQAPTSPAPPQKTLPPVAVPPTTSSPALTKDYTAIMTDLEKSFPKLALELKELPELQGNPSDSDVEALNDIYYLWKNATNPEVKEAFDLIIKGGTPSQKDFSYQVPTYNTELQVLFWLAEQNEFHFNDTLAQAIAMVNGLWVTMGDDEVRKTVKKDTNDLLEYFRETNEWQRENGLYLLEDYPLEAKVALAWTGDQSSTRSYHDPRDYLDKKMNLRAYRWATIEVSNLNNMHIVIERNKWIKSDVSETVLELERYFKLNGDNWIFPDSEDLINIDGESIINHNFNSADLEFKYYLKNKKGIGWCSDQMGLLNALLKSVGISTTALWGDLIENNEKIRGHTHIIFFDMKLKKWRAYEEQLNTDVNNKFNEFFITIPRINLPNVKMSNEGRARRRAFSIYFLPYSNVQEIKILFEKGIPTTQIKQWLLYSS